MAVYTSNMAPIGVNFGKTRFRWFPTFHFSTPKKKIGEKNLQKNRTSNQERAVLEEPWIFERYWQIGLEKWPPMNLISAPSDFWRRGKKGDFRFLVDFWPKTDLQFSLANDNMMMWWYGDMMEWWYDDRMMWWFNDVMIYRHDDMMLWSYDDRMIRWCDEVMIAYDPTHH